jgi:copper chaperone CopZ
MVKKTFQIADMHCSSCAMLLEGIEDELAGVRSVKASYRKGTLEVEFDETRVTDEMIVTAIQKKGYRVAST